MEPQETLRSGQETGHGEKRFKACRSCRKHKLKCERHAGYTDGRCRRCVESELVCIFDVIGSRKRKAQFNGIYHDNAVITGNSRQGTVLPNNRASGSDVSSSVEVLAAQMPSMAMSTANHIVSQADETGSTFRVDSHGITGSTSVPHSPGLTSTDLRAPVSAIHNMSPENFSDAASRPSTTRPSDSNHFDRWQSRSLFKRDIHEADVISKGILTQAQARHLFHQFMSSASIFLPIFDTALDSFDALRKREPLCFSVILALACRLEGSLTDQDKARAQACLAEVKLMVAESLFSSTPSLGNIQGIILLAAYAESIWFAIGHGLRMAADLGLDKAISQLSLHSEHGNHPLDRRRLMRKTRVWLALCFMDREIAMGLARPPRNEYIQVSDLKIFCSLPQAIPSDLRLASLVEAVDTRDELHRKLTAHEYLESSGYDELLAVSSRFRQWHTYWDALHKDFGFDESSFQRISLRGQMHYAIIFLGCACLGRFSSDKPLSTTLKASYGAPFQILKLVVSTAMKQLRLVLTAESYQWHLKWATNYTILSLTFTVVFVLEVLRYRTDLLDAEEVISTAHKIRHLLGEYHDQFFSNLIQARLSKHARTLAETSAVPAGSSLEHTLPAIQPGSNEVESSHDTGDHRNNGQQSAQALSGFQSANMGLNETDNAFPLSDLLEMPDWMINPTFMLGHDLAEWELSGS